MITHHTSLVRQELCEFQGKSAATYGAVPVFFIALFFCYLECALNGFQNDSNVDSDHGLP